MCRAKSAEGFQLGSGWYVETALLEIGGMGVEESLDRSIHSIHKMCLFDSDCML